MHHVLIHARIQSLGLPICGPRPQLARPFLVFVLGRTMPGCRGKTPMNPIRGTRAIDRQASARLGDGLRIPGVVPFAISSGSCVVGTKVLQRCKFNEERSIDFILLEIQSRLTLRGISRSYASLSASITKVQCHVLSPSFVLVW